MARNKVNRNLEGSFLFILILMIYTLTIIPVNGQMIRELSFPEELNLVYTDDQSKTEEQIFVGNLRMMKATHQFNLSKKNYMKEAIKGFIDKQDSAKQTQFTLPDLDLRRRKIGEFNAPSILLPSPF